MYATTTAWLPPRLHFNLLAYYAKYARWNNYIACLAHNRLNVGIHPAYN